MKNFKEVMIKVLIEADGGPLKAKEIIKIAVEKYGFETTGKTPHATLLSNARNRYQDVVNVAKGGFISLKQLEDSKIESPIEKPAPVQEKANVPTLKPAKQKAPTVQKDSKTEKLTLLNELMKMKDEIFPIPSVKEDSGEKKKFVPSKQQADVADFIENGTENGIVEALAGTGKTTTIIESVRLMKGKVFIGAFNSDIAKEIDERIKADPELYNRPYPEQGIDRSTFHSAGRKMIRYALGDSPRLNRNKVRDIVSKKVERHEIDPRYALSVEKTVDMAKQHGFIDKDKAGWCGRKYLTSINYKPAWSELIEEYDTDHDARIKVYKSGSKAIFRTDLLIDYSIDVLKESTQDFSCIDFSDMILFPLAHDFSFKWRYDFLVVDEAQDLNPTRRAMIMNMVKKDGRIIAVGDRHQAIYGWAGADTESIDRIADLGNFKRFPLSKSFRCPQEVIKLAQTIVPEIEAVDTAPKGKVLNTDYEDVISVLKTIDRDRYQHTAILCRYNQHIVSMCFRLIREGIPAKVEGRSIGDGLINLAQRWKRPKTLQELRDKVAEYCKRETEKAAAAGRESRVDMVNDQAATLNVILDNLVSEGKTSIQDVVDRINNIFDDTADDDGKNENVITLSTIHKAKGREWTTVMILDREVLMTPRIGRKEGQLYNLQYVGITRSKNVLLEILNVPGNDKDKKEDNKTENK